MSASPHIDENLRQRRKLQNSLQTALLAGGSVGLLALCAYIIAGPEGVFWAALGGSFSLYVATHVSPQMVLGLYRARPLPASVFPEGHHILLVLARRAGLPSVPVLYYVPSKMMNAFAVGRPEEAVICVTDGLIRKLTAREFAGVLAHELSHIRNGDVRVMALADIVARMTSTMSFLGLFLFFFHMPSMLEGGGNVPWLLILLLVAAPTVGTLLQLALSRTREFDADLDAVDLTGDPEGLASALLKLERVQGRMWEAMALPGARIPDPSILRTHPATDERVRRIRALTRSVEPFDFDHAAPISGKSFVPKIGNPRFRARGLGLWY
ncbi:zinc metalloprotease HtpX [Polymorphum gilvum]|uniref:Peptidase M48 Ste24p n=1 Tax=Polymorphum gilvum (strain LMG 25793 / CGMCC 1.9160 / SL003B-26A1) TaxID=991905 RepID=F2J3M6_POLGS|nr:zinc metalloprotease HtpX [Polymorphum gilvum]ADZ72162.1 Peptidase M48 Ste24p [Polymorphum gilvum SL003B-26A1]